jgi:hypothetical protein
MPWAGLPGASRAFGMLARQNMHRIASRIEKACTVAEP